jgi:hypothetical protein
MLPPFAGGGGRKQIMRMLIPTTCVVSIVLLPQIPGILPELGRGSTTQPQEKCVIEVRRKVSLGDLKDSVSVRIPLEVDVAEVPWGGWVVTENGNYVMEYAPTGAFRRTLGRRGEGPGEFLRPSMVAIDPTDSTWVSEKRGRAVIFGPDGHPARTLSSPLIYEIEGFTESGLPYAMLAKAVPSGTSSLAWRYIQVWSREGEPLFQLGPGHFAPDVRGRTIDLLVGDQSTFLGDTLVVVPTAWENWLTYWSASREWVSAPADSVWRTLGLDDPPDSFSDGRPVAVLSDGREGYWVLGIVRRLSEEQEEALVRSAPEVRGQSLDTFKRGSAPISNAVYDGALIHVTSDGSITSGTTFEERPRGFASPSQFYTFTETELGLIQIHIWEFEEDCSVSEPPLL